MQHQRGIILANAGTRELTQEKMIRSIQIRGYRGLSDFEMAGLGQVNLLVGTNNSGKTSVLEGLYLFASQGSPWSVWQVLWRRGERLAERNPNNQPEIDICHLFHGHEAQIGSKFSLSAQNDTPERHLTFSIAEMDEEQRKKQQITKDGVPIPSRLGLFIKSTTPASSRAIPLTRLGGVTSDSLDTPRRSRLGSPSDEVPSSFITAESLDGDSLVSLWDKIALTPHEERVNLALRFLEPGIERIAAQASRQNYYSPSQRGGFLVKMKGHDRPVPIGSLGDGMWRIMAMAIVIAQCKDGVLLIDEIDTGLHYSVMTNMWRLIYGAAKELNVQVFATTHSNDCVRSLADLYCVDGDVATDISLQRIEKGRKKAVPYTAKELEIAAEKQIEVR